jgi:hypothetical protein
MSWFAGLFGKKEEGLPTRAASAPTAPVSIVVNSQNPTANPPSRATAEHLPPTTLTGAKIAEGIVPTVAKLNVRRANGYVALGGSRKKSKSKSKKSKKSKAKKSSKRR